MHCIRPWLVTGKYAETEDRDLLDDNAITAMVQLHRPVEQPGIPTLYMPTEEGYHLPKGALDDALAFIVPRHEAGETMLIACGMGVSRSATFAVAALKQVEGLTLVEAFAEVRKVNSQAMPDVLHWQDLCAYFDEHIDFWEMWKQIEL